ncbi:MAG TPA: NUDIX hydrolase [Burkholderiales bacterium]
MTTPSGDLTERTVSSRVLHRGRLLDVREDQVLLPDGKAATREYIRHPGAVVVIALLEDERLVLERQWRHPLRRVLIELPAGKIDAGEDVLACAMRELAEETGYVAGRWSELATVYPCVGYSDERLVFFLARGLRQEGAAPDEGEHLEVFSATLDEALDWVRQGVITDGKTLIGLFWADKILRGGWGP